MTFVTFDLIGFRLMLLARCSRTLILKVILPSNIASFLPNGLHSNLGVLKITDIHIFKICAFIYMYT